MFYGALREEGLRIGDVKYLKREEMERRDNEAKQIRNE